MPCTNLFFLFLLSVLFFFSLQPSNATFDSSDTEEISYHNGPILSSNISVHIVWYGNKWELNQKHIIRSFIHSISDESAKHPSVSSWWKTAQLYIDEIGNNVSRHVTMGMEKNMRNYPHGKRLTRMSVQYIIKSATTSKTNPLPINPGSSFYLVLSSSEVEMLNFGIDICGFHFFTFPSIVGYALPFAWIGNAIEQCPSFCAVPFVAPSFSNNFQTVLPPNGDIGADAMINIIGHEIAELSTNPLTNGWFAGNSMFPYEIADMCLGIFGAGAGGAYIGDVFLDNGEAYNVHGSTRRFLLQWIWDPIGKSCQGPNALQ